uniref:PIN domain nuclease, a component of toxin-antitoxin system (PIN domain) n=1 Tax=Candidatus Kentrum sp. SD TaxID=2126332 RepID=A0A450YWY2_9GAMM|nr:MAG: PIN domain nuclease, a component of toxin-antitoxin system (PIN domain) [Candidatus Kentron sp. SD]VFK46048.1 MAG: PIN domain nuclease, a component of toxin-antitoxin system (PIN domain) [Candidatus Kentron sp. SD]
MRLLLDTHIWLWSLLEPGRLGEKTVEALENKDNELFISPITIWETMVLAEKGKIELELPLEDWVKKALERSPIKEAKLSHEIAVKSRLIDLPHKDPADRFIAATAWQYDLILVTMDEKLKKSGQIKIFNYNRQLTPPRIIA